MTPVIPYDILEKLVCDFCHKFLSVKPVKLFPGNKIKCGRCSNNEDEDGVTSLYEFIADQFYFPCVNLYDGCDEFLSLSQVAAHEKTCQSKCFACPTCEEEIPTYLMIKHYRDVHKEALLGIPCFSIDLKVCLQTVKWFLYKLNNKLFFINCSLNWYDDTFSLKAEFLGDLKQSEIISLNFFICYGSTTTKEMLFFPHNETNSMEWNVSSLTFDLQDMITVRFQISIEQQLLLATKAPVSSLKSNATKKNASLVVSSEIFTERDMTKPRFIFLNSGLRKAGIFTLDSTSTHFVDNRSKKKIHPECQKCGELDIYNRPYIAISDNYEKVFTACSFCSKVTDLSKVVDRQFFECDYLWQLDFFCIWKCNSQSFNIKDVLAHEFTCDKQPTRFCPLESCPVQGKLFDIEKHFEEHSPMYSISFGSLATVNLCPTKSPMKKFLLVRNAFVYIEFKWVEPFWHSTCKLCGEKNTFAGMKLKAKIIDETNGKILGSCEQGQKILFHHTEAVTIKCYLKTLTTFSKLSRSFHSLLNDMMMHNVQ